uniref:Uncharacterized protein n=1 Tax=Anguilla anguilla TaxID=7936 RepID=A0A0E9S419_ANGAN
MNHNSQPPEFIDSCFSSVSFF